MAKKSSNRVLQTNDSVTDMAIFGGVIFILLVSGDIWEFTSVNH